VTAVELANQQVNLSHILLADKDGKLIVTADNKYIAVKTE
jgi:hypothetical protein